MFCTKCGQQNADDSAFCSACGNSLTSPGQASPSPHPPTQTDHLQEEIPSYLAFSIIVTLLCCLPTGIVAIVYAAQVNSKQVCGDIAGARAASESARTWCWISFGIGLAVMVIYFLIVAAAGVG